MRWLGHLVKMPPGCLPGEVFRACPTGRRPRERPRTRWRDYVSRLAWESLGWRWSGTGMSGLLCSKCCPNYLTPGEAADDGWIDGQIGSSSAQKVTPACFPFLTALLYGTKEEPFYREAGSSLTVGCSFNIDGRTKYFCRGRCEENILVQTDGDRVQRGRYSIRYVKAMVGGFLYVTISQLTQADSGRYGCYLDRTFIPDGSTEFTISVTDGEFLLNQNALNVSERLKHVLSSVTDSCL